MPSCGGSAKRRRAAPESAALRARQPRRNGTVPAPEGNVHASIVPYQTFRASEIVNSLLNFSRTKGAAFGPLDVNRVISETLLLRFRRGSG